MIDLRQVGLHVGGRSLLEGVAAHIETGEFIAVLGPNGVGKTTLLRAIAGLRAPSSGTILLDGAPSAHLGSLERAKRVALVSSEEVLLDELRVREVVSIGRFPHHRWWQWQERTADEIAVERALTAVRIQDFAERFFSTLSAGERQRVWIALGLAQETPILLLDEPTSHLDVRVAHEILDLLRDLTETGKTVMCALHDLNEAAAYADRIALLSAGTLLALDVPDSVLTDRLLEQTYGIAMERIRLANGRLRVFARESATSSGESRCAVSARRNQAPNG